MNIFAVHPDIEKIIKSLDPETQGKVLKLIEVLSIESYHLGMPFSKKLEKDLYELRISSIQNVRVFYTFSSNSVVLLHIFTKKTQKLPANELKTARNRLTLLHQI
ncbi:MAG: type II toxin-antitoxin system RelE/ParE family toxin [Minisyncoccota bacterium]